MSTGVICAYTNNNRSQVASLVAQWPFKPLARHHVWGAANLFDLAAQRVMKTLENENGAAWVMVEGNQARGFASLTMLPWDSEQIGVTAARLDYLIAEGSGNEQQQIKKALLACVMEHAEVRGVRHLSIRVDASDTSSLHALERCGFLTVDGILTFALDLNAYRPAPSNHDFQIRLATVADANAAAALARTAYVHDRFHSDPSIARERADELHASWVRNSCTGDAADAVWLAQDESGLLGYVTCSVQRDTAERLGHLVGTIVLVATAERARGRGVGQANTMAALEWFRQRGCQIVEVGTQLRNIPASRLYQKCGFQIVGSSVSLRRLILPILSRDWSIRGPICLQGENHANNDAN